MGDRTWYDPSGEYGGTGESGYGRIGMLSDVGDSGVSMGLISSGYGVSVRGGMGIGSATSRGMGISPSRETRARTVREGEIGANVLMASLGGIW